MKPIAILHEGNDKSSLDNKLIKELIKYLKFDIEQVDFYGMGVKSNFFKPDYIAYKALKQPVEESQITRIFFVIDADNDFEQTQNQLESIIKELNIEAISSFYIMCHPDTKKGYVESFILSTIPKDKMECIDKFLECSGFIANNGDKSTYERIYKSIAHPLSPYKFDHENFNDLKTKLENLFI
jgi:hypothetical protein